MFGAHETLDTFESDLTERCDHDNGKDKNTQRFEPIVMLASFRVCARHSCATYLRRPTG